MMETEAAQVQADQGWAAEVRRLAAQRDAVILAHNYQAPEIQDVADHVGDSLALSRLAAASTASVIVFAGVYFMAETAKILAPDRTVLIPEPKAGCSLADSITAAQVRQWKAEHPGAAVVAYVNTSAEVKAEADLCCTSANAAQIVASVPAEQEVLFLPDQFLGAHVQRATGRANMHIWLGECHVHAGISPDELRGRPARTPRRSCSSIPECGCSTAALWQAGTGDLPPGRTRVLSTGGMLEAARATTAPSVLVATETGHAAPAPPGQPGGPLGAGQPRCRMPVHEDEHAGGPAALPARGRHRGDRRSRGGPPGPPRRRSDAHRRARAAHRRARADAGRGEDSIERAPQPAPVAGGLGTRRRRGGGGIGSGRDDSGPGRGPPRPPGAAADQG